MEYGARSRILKLSFAFLSLPIGNAALAAGDPARGEKVFQACTACHSVKPGEHLTGPSLAGIWEQKAGTVPGFLRYSDALKHASVVWTEATLDQWLSNPEQFISGTSMTFQGLQQKKDREDLIAFLKAVSEGKAPAEGGDMNMRSRNPSLKKAPPQGQVVALGHCGDTYTVKTADGNINKVWEFNLRLKTDSGETGPLPGKPVIVGTGMQGDRAAVVFAAPSEISNFIRESCQ